jgi:hypothetical protein
MTDDSSSPLVELLTRASDGAVRTDFSGFYESVRRRRRFRRTMSVVTIVACAVLVVPLAIGVGYHVAHVRSAHAKPVSYPIQLPADYVQPTGLASEPGGSGVWYFAQGGAQPHPKETVFHWVRATGRTTSYPILLPAGGLTPLAVSPSGVAWLGVGSTLFTIDPSNAARPVTRRSLPIVASGDSYQGLPHLPPGAVPEIQSLAVNAAGRLIIARTFATSLQLLDPSSGAVTSIALPRLREVDGAGQNEVAAANGDSAIVAVVGPLVGRGAQRHSVTSVLELITGKWHTVASPCPPYGFSATALTLVVHGEHCIAVRPGPPGSQVVSVPTETKRPITCAEELSQDVILVCRPGGAYLDNLRTGVTSPVRLGSVRSNGVTRVPLGVTSGEPRPKPTPTSIPIMPTLVTSAGDGAAFFVPDEGPNRIGLLTTTG